MCLKRYLVSCNILILLHERKTQACLHFSYKPNHSVKVLKLFVSNWPVTSSTQYELFTVSLCLLVGSAHRGQDWYFYILYLYNDKLWNKNFVRFHLISVVLLLWCFWCSWCVWGWMWASGKFDLRLFLNLITSQRIKIWAF